jgi:hypothetical protein
MLQVVKAAAFNAILSFIVFRMVSRAGYQDGTLEHLIVGIFIGGPYLALLWGFAPKWFEYKGDNAVVRWIWVSCFIPALPLLLFYWIFY